MRAHRVLCSLTFIALLSAGAFAAEEKSSAPTLPPLGVWQSPTGKDVVIDLKSDRTMSLTDDKTGRPPLKKEEPVPFLGLSLTRPLGQ